LEEPLLDGFDVLIAHGFAEPARDPAGASVKGQRGEGGLCPLIPVGGVLFDDGARGRDLGAEASLGLLGGDRLAWIEGLCPIPVAELGIVPRSLGREALKGLDGLEIAVMHNGAPESLSCSHNLEELCLSL
jgi:hypothetical protein